MSDVKDDFKVLPGDLIRVTRPSDSPINESHLGIFIKTDTTKIGEPGSPGSSLLITQVVMAAGQIMRFNFPYWKFEVVSSSDDK